MPASSTNLIDAALHSALKKKGPSCNKEFKSDLEEQLNASSKQIFLHDIEYEHSLVTQSFVLNNLKSKYVHVLGNGKLNYKNTFSSPHQKNKMAQGRTEDKLEEPRVTLWAADKVVLGWRKTFPPGAGMINLGNTCYMNSSLQALFHIPSFVNWLLEEVSTHIPNCEANLQNASFCSICGMMKTLKLSLDRGNSVIKPSFIHSKLKSIGKTLLYGRQEDAHEFIKLLLDHMEKSFIYYKRATKLDHCSKETTPLNQIFGGYLRQQVICPLCCYVSTTFSPFQDIVLDIRSVGSVDEALNLYFRKETLDSDNAYKCEKCHKKVPATKRHLIERAPHVLLLQLKRFTISGGKITKHVNIQKTIDLSKYVNGVKSTQPNGSGPYFYRLASMVIHIGSSQHGGHYTAIAEASNNTMFEFDDASVRPISVQSALLRNPYILFYEMVRKPKGISGPKQVIRQSSEKALLRQSSNEKIPKPFPTSLSTSCMWNGTSTDAIGDAATQNGIAENKKSPLLSQKERERISFGIKSTPNRSQDSEKFPKLLTLGVHNGTHYKPSFPLNSSTRVVSSSSSPNVKNGQTSSLVPYNDDSEDSDYGKEINGCPLKENGYIKRSIKHNEKRNENTTGNNNSIDGGGSSKNGKKASYSDINKGISSNSEASKNIKGAKISDESKNGKITEANLNGSVVGSSKSIGKKPSFLPRTLQVHSTLNGKEPVMNKQSVAHIKLANTDCSKQTELKDDKDARSYNSNHPLKENLLLNGTLSHLKGDKNGSLRTENYERSPSENSNCSSTSSQGFVVTEKSKGKTQATGIDKEKDSSNGWTVTVQSPKQDSHKTFSQEYISASKRPTPDKSETASVKSKDSLDSNRSDKSTKSIKKSFFSLFPCVSSSRSPDFSPEEQTNSVIEKKVHSPVRIDPKRSPSLKNLTQQLQSDSSESLNDTSDDDIFQLKRNRDIDEHEPLSPFKKCRPENVQENDSSSVKMNKYSERSPDLTLSERLQGQKGEEKNYKSNTSKGCSSSTITVPNTSTSFNCKNGKNSSTKDEENFSMGERKKSRHKRKKKSNTNAERHLTNSSSDHNVSCPLEMGTSRLHPNVVPVQWNRHLKDLSCPQKKIKSQIEELTWDTTENTSVANALREAAEFPFGIKVETWDGQLSFLTHEMQRERRESSKRTLEEIYEDELDQGKEKKRYKTKKQEYDNSSPKENPFQKFQDDVLNQPNQFDQPYQSYKPTPFNHKHFRSNNYGNRNNSFPNNRKFGADTRRNSWHSSAQYYHPQNNVRGNSSPFPQNQNRPHWNTNYGSHRKYFNKKRGKFPPQKAYNRY